MSDVLIGRIIGKIKESMNDHAHDAMKLKTRDLAQYCEIVGAYRGLEDALEIIEGVLRESVANDS